MRCRIYTQKGSKETQLFGFKLLKQIASLQTRLSMSDDETVSVYDIALGRHARVNPYSFITLYTLQQRWHPHFVLTSISTHQKLFLAFIQEGRVIWMGLRKPLIYLTSHMKVMLHPKDSLYLALAALARPNFAASLLQTISIGMPNGSISWSNMSDLFSFWGVFTIDASSPGNAQQSFIAIAKACGTDPNERAAKSWLSSVDRPWLLLIDNADGTELEIERYFPDGEHGLILISTRNPDVKMHGTIGRRFYHFEKLDDEEANELLLRAADNNEPRTPKIMQLASAITRKLGALPLALIHAGNAIKARYCELSNYIPYYERSWDLIRESQNKTGQNDDDPEYMKVYASYEIVFRGLEATNLQRYSDAVQLLKLFSFLHYENIPFDMLIAAVEHPRIQREADSQGTQLIESADLQDRTSIEHLKAWWAQLRSVADSFLWRQFMNQNPVVLPTFLRDAELSNPLCDYKVRLREALHLLTRLSLITHDEASDSYSMHPLVHTWIR